jgi:hypothetical protein
MCYITGSSDKCGSSSGDDIESNAHVIVVNTIQNHIIVHTDQNHKNKLRKHTLKHFTVKFSYKYASVCAYIRSVCLLIEIHNNKAFIYK